ncbi:MAG: recombinase RecA [Deltaproteobacteria bacterium]|jgi:recombination protein RecA|nr:recombinase RecA [Deltaproteobacteria bacterium]
MARATDKDKKKDKDKGQDNLDPKAKALKSAVEQIEKSFGKGSIMKLGGEDQEAIPVISTGSISLDAALGVGGIPRGRIVEIFGPESSGKTTLALHLVAEAQKKKNAQGQNGVAAFIDAEHALDVSYARRLGVNTDELLISQPDNGEQALNIAEILVRSGAVDLIVIDSVAALVPAAEIDGDMGSVLPGSIARLMSQAMRKLTGCISRSMTSVVFINQVRLKIGPMAYGNPETTTGGYALKFYATMRLDIRRAQFLKGSGSEEARIGNMTRVKVVKNKIAPPFKEATFDIIYGYGISRESELLDLGSVMDVVEKSGNWYAYEGERLGNGKDAARRFLIENPEVANSIEEKLRGAYGLLAEKVTESMADSPLEPIEADSEGVDPELAPPEELSPDLG